MQECKPIPTLFPTNDMLSSKTSPSSKEERMKMSRVPYASSVGSLMFMMICIRPDIAHAVGVVSRNMVEPGRDHWKAVKRILRYIKETSDVLLCFEESDFTVKGYVNSDYVGDLDKSKSTTKYVFTLSSGTVLKKDIYSCKLGMLDALLEDLLNKEDASLKSQDSVLERPYYT
ncbi:hypothetical protein Tco_1052445 [Tanacetum coccineum]